MSAWLRRDAARMQEIVAVLADTMRVGERDGSDSMLYGAFAARLAVLRADTARAIALLSSLSPRGSMGSIGWEWMASLAEERLLLSQLLLARRRYADALAVAGVLDAAQAMAYALYLPDGLELRIRAAAALGKGTLAERYRQRLARLRPPRGG
jgi:hypothetical protein